MKRFPARRLGVAFVATTLVVSALGLVTTSASATNTVGTGLAQSSTNYVSLVKVGTRNATRLGSSSTTKQPGNLKGSFLQGPEGSITRSSSPSTDGALAPTNLSVSSLGSSAGGAKSTTGSTGFMGITGTQQATANAAYDLEPPDQGLCSNGTDVVEAVNNAYAVYSPSGQVILGPIALSSLFGISSESAGTFTSDPRCFYDAPTKRWFVVELSIPNYFSAHIHASSSYELIAVSNSGDPTGSFTTFAINATDPGGAGCPCFGDYPMIGLDANGFYLTTNEFSIYKPDYNGVQLYAISKAGLEAATTGAPSPTVVHFGSLASPFPAETVGETYHLSPALTPGTNSYATVAKGTEYFTMSDVFPVSSDLLSVYALTNTSTLTSNTPDLHLSSSLVTLGQFYQFPETGLAVPQKSATSPSQTPLLDSIETITGASVPEGVLQADFDAVQETTYANNELFTSISNSSTPTASVGTTSAQWYVLKPTATSTGVSASLANEGNVGVMGQSLLYPDVVVNSSGVGDMVFTLTGSKYYPSAAYVAFGSNGVTGSVQVAAPGTGPEDGFTCYAYYVGANYGGCRWGDFSGGVAVGSTIWMATEYIPPASTRDTYTNWGTFLFNAPAG